MKKLSLLTVTGASVALVGLFGGGQYTFAATAGTPGTPSTAQTPITAQFTAPTNPTNPLPPDGPITPTKPTGTFGIAYVPSAMTFNDTLSTGAMSIAAKNGTAAYGTTHVGVKDTSYDNKGWDLTAQLNWTGSAVPGANIKLTTGGVKENVNDGTTAFNPGTDLVAPTVGAGSFTAATTPVTIGSTGTQSILKATDGVIYTGTYDLDLSNISLEIPNGRLVNAGNYSGNIDWNLSVNP